MLTGILCVRNWLTISLIFCLPSNGRADIFSISDQDFPNVSWTTLVYTGGTGGSATASQYITIGFPPPSRRISITVLEPGPAGVGVLSLFDGVQLQLDPNTKITQVDFSFSVTHIQSTESTFAQSLIPALEQSGVIYLANVSSGIFQGNSNRTIAWSSLNANSFRMLRPLAGHLVPTDPSITPNFSGGDTIRFGFFSHRGDSTPGGPPQETHVVAYDNFSVIVTTVSEPAITSLFPYHFSYTGSGTPPWNRLDTSKTLVKEGTGPQLLTYDNLINTAQGINGVVFDIENLPDAGNLSVEDFEFQVSPQGAFDDGANPPANWQSAPAPSSITVTPGLPDRVLIQWPDESIMNRWLRITVLATEETGLAEPETYYIGHLLGESTGLDNGVFTVSFADITPIRAEVGQTVDASSITDIDKNGTVSFADISAMRGNVGSQLTQISVP